eukprot:Phypoly_transcript_04196.p1 GENE.Phypoly_transcript_04196~~Phypoly_transcript_04196.p1  ORF type:complete len:626 (+),score=80.37 Phypoly_transcript_04196:108-1985(+)
MFRMDVEKQKQVEQCIGLLHGPSDEQRFVGLLLATKVIQPDDKENISKIYNAMGTKFLNKLLRSDKEEGLYKSLALNVLSTFCRNMPEIIDDPFFVERLPTVLDLIHTSNDETLIADGWACVEGVLMSPKGIIKILKENYTTFIANFIVDPGNDTKLHKMLQIIMQMVSIFPSLPVNIYVEAYPITMKLAKEFWRRKDLMKFELLNTIIALVSTFGSHPIPNQPMPEWAVEVRAGVLEILSSKVTSKQRDPAIILSGLVLDLVGKEWPLGNNKFVELLLQVIKIEFRLSLEEDEILEPKFPLFTICFRILENYIQFLGKGEWSSLPSEILSRVGEAFVDIFRDVLFLIRNHSNLTFGTSFYQLEESAVRVVGHWLVSETEALRKDVEDSLPSIFPYLEKNMSLLETWISVFPSLTTDETMQEVFVQQGGVQILVTYINAEGRKKLEDCKQELSKNNTTLGDATAILTNTLDIFLNLFFLAPDIQHQTNLANELVSIFPILVAGLQEFANLNLQHEEYFSIYAHFVSITLTAMCQLSPAEVPTLDDINYSVITFFNTQDCLNEVLWSEVGDLWTLAVRGLIKCFPKFPKLKEQFTSSKLGRKLKQSGTSNMPKFLHSSLSPLLSQL